MIVGSSVVPNSVPSRKAISDEITIRKICVDQTLDLRHSVLWPHKSTSYVRLPEDNLGHHYGAFLLHATDTPIAVISVFDQSLPATNPSASDVGGLATLSAARFRKFACDPRHRNHGIGSALLRHVIATASSELGCGVIWCDARVTTKDWDERRGMRAFGETFFKGEVEYVRMLYSLKSLS